MTIKNIALALLAVPAMANQHCEPDAAQPHFALEVAGGGTTMNGHVQSKTTSPTLSIDGMRTLGINFPGTISLDNKADVTVPMDIVTGYQAGWNKMMPLPSLMNFGGQLNVHYNYFCNGMGLGLYAGVGHNASRSSSTIPASFDSNIQSYLYSTSYPGEISEEDVKEIQTADVFTMGNNEATSPLQNRVQGTTTIPMGKATVHAGLMFQAGGRFGVMCGNAFPHLRAGWACYNFTAHMTNQHKPWINNVPVQAKSNCVIATNGAGSLLSVDSQKDADANLTVGIGQYMPAFADAYKTNNPIKIKSKSQWTNALTLGAGVDWAWNKTTVGLFYQVGICQKLTFKKWNKDVTSGLTNVYADLLGLDRAVLSTSAQFQPTGGSLYMVYDKHTPEVSIAPVMHTVMFSVKYVVAKAA